MKKIYSLLFCYLLFILGLFFINFGLFISHPAPQLLTNLGLLLIVYFGIIFIFMVIALYDKIIADERSRDLVDQINLIISTELKNSKINPKLEQELKNG